MQLPEVKPPSYVIHLLIRTVRLVGRNLFRLTLEEFSEKVSRIFCESSHQCKMNFKKWVTFIRDAEVCPYIIYLCLYMLIFHIFWLLFHSESFCNRQHEIIKYL